MMGREELENLRYAFGHAVSSYAIDAHSGDSADLANDVFDSMALTPREREIIWHLAVEVAGDWQYTGASSALLRDIQNGDL